MTPKVGDIAPSISLYDQDRKLRTLQEFTSKGNVVVAFFPGAFTSVCTKEMCTFRDSLSNFSGLGQVIGISIDTPFALKAFSEANKLNFPLLSDYEKKAIRDYGVEYENFVGLPGYKVARRSVFVVGRDQKVKYVWLAPEQGVEPNYKEVEQALR
ncbi:MAG: redoxin domain-containing protein [Conexivisphaerales archaeon]